MLGAATLLRFESGQTSLDDVLACLDAHPEALVLVSPTLGLATLPKVRAYLVAHYDVLGDFAGRAGKHHVLHRRRRAMTAPTTARGDIVAG